MWCADLPLDACSPTAFRVLLKYADRVDDLGYHGWHTEAFLAEKLRCSERTIRRARAELVEAGLIRVSDQQVLPGGRADRRPKVYDILTTSLRAHEAHGGTWESWNRVSRGDNPGRKPDPRGDNPGSHGGTPVVHINSPKTTYQDTHRDLTLVTARESDEAS